MQDVISIMENGSTEKLMAMENIVTRTVQPTKDIGLLIDNTEMG